MYVSVMMLTVQETRYSNVDKRHHSREAASDDESENATERENCKRKWTTEKETLMLFSTYFELAHILAR